MKTSVIVGFCVLAFCNSGLTSETCKEDSCHDLKHMRLGVRYTGPKGIGYDKGYFSLETFIAPPFFISDAWLPFIDLRGHTFGMSKYAFNAGLGARYLSCSRIWGGNVYYDHRRIKHQHYNQVSLGFETLGRVWDFRLNGYLPIGKKQANIGHARFASFEGNSILINRRREFAMKGANAEVGVHVDHFKQAPLYFALGPYYLTGKGETTWGGEARAVVELFHRHLRLEGNTSYDHHFKWIGQGQIGLNFFFGGTSRKNDCYCSKIRTLHHRAIQQVDRFEIIPVTEKHESSVAINPATGDPWVFWFVNNTSSSLGTFESPFPTLLQAQNASSANQGIYVFPGNGTTSGMDAGIILKDSQLFLGASTEHAIPTTRGTIVIPILASSLPKIANLSGDVVTLANNNTVSGFHITTQGGHGIAGNGILNLIASQNLLDTIVTNTDGIHLLNPSGQVLISNSAFNGFSNSMSAIYVEVNTGNTLDKLNVEKSSFSNFDNNGRGVFALLGGGSIGTLNVTKSEFSNLDNISRGISVTLNNHSMIHLLNVSESSFSNINNSSIGCFVRVNDGTINTLNVTRSLFTQINSNEGMNILLNGSDAMILSANVLGNNFSEIGVSGIGVLYDNVSAVGDFLLDISNNHFSGTSSSSSGYAASVDISSGTTCLNFTNNQATPVTSPTPYLFEQFSSGIFNRTFGSDNTRNVGEIGTMGNVGLPGSCSQ